MRHMGETPAMILGYARVSTREQNPDSQDRLLKDSGAERVFIDRGESSRHANRPGWQRLLETARPGDTVLVTALDRLAGNQRLALELIGDLGERNINIRSLTDPDIDTTTPMGAALFSITAVLLQLRVDTIRANTIRGLEHARAQGRIGGRPTVMTVDKKQAAEDMRAQGRSYRQIAAALGVSTSAVHRAIGAYST